MNNQEVLSIDLGSAYTKVALRTGWNTDTQLVRDTGLATKDATYCIPSVVACVTREGKDKWLIGAGAANQIPGPGVRIYENWKAALFGMHSPLQPEESRTLARRFFESLRRTLSLGELWDDINSVPLRVCIPKLGDNENLSEQTLVEILEGAGWKCAVGRTTVFEPESNVLGVLSRARNVTWMPPYEDFRPWLGRSVHLPSMLEPNIQKAFRKWAKGDPYGVLVIDIGAFTTDFGYVLFDTSFWTDNWNKPIIRQQSIPLGIRDLDEEVKNLLTPQAREAIEGSSSAEWERNKTALYSGKDVAFRHPTSGVIVVGKGGEAEAVKGAVESFAQRVVQARRHFYKTHELARIDAQILTGGGAMIPGLRQVAKADHDTNRPFTYHDLLDEDEPRRVLPKLDNHDDEQAIEARGRQNRELVRGGSAIGGCSVFFE